MFKVATFAAVGMVSAEDGSCYSGCNVLKHVPDWEMPGHGIGTARKIPTYEEVNALPLTYCVQCLWSGGTY